jgi:carbon-monoxide dehydrogenase medium subunit
MKPVSFRYFAPRTVDDELDLLATHGQEGKILAGGQSLVPAMNFRLARPTAAIPSFSHTDGIFGANTLPAG